MKPVESLVSLQLPGSHGNSPLPKMHLSTSSSENKWWSIEDAKVISGCLQTPERYLCGFFFSGFSATNPLLSYSTCYRNHPSHSPLVTLLTCSPYAQGSKGDLSSFQEALNAAAELAWDQPQDITSCSPA